MAIFELDGGRGSLVQPMRPRTDSFEVDSATLIGEHAAALVGEQVLPVREGAPGGPHLLALDAASRPFVVEVAPLLDETALVRALRHAGGAARLSRADLARMYPGGGEAFEADLAVFRDRAPLVRSQAPGDGVRLVIVCAEVAEGVLDAVEYVTAGTQVEVLRLGVTQGPGGRRYVEVAPLPSGQGAAPARRAVEPGPRTGAVQVAPRASGSAVTDPTPTVPAPAGPAPAGPATAAAATPAAATPGPATAGPAPAPGPAPVGVPAQADAPVVREGRPQPVAAASEHPHRHVATGLRADETTLLPPVPAEGPAPSAARPVPDAPSPAGDGPAAAVPPAPGASPVLAALAASHGGDVELVWHRARRGQRFVATLRGDGLIGLADGSVHTDPGAAASAAADLESATDGWRVWRVGDDGPTLGEATAG